MLSAAVARDHDRAAMSVARWYGTRRFKDIVSAYARADAALNLHVPFETVLEVTPAASLRVYEEM